MSRSRVCAVCKAVIPATYDGYCLSIGPTKDLGPVLLWLCVKHGREVSEIIRKVANT
mgnify:FL=1